MEKMEIIYCRWRKILLQTNILLTVMIFIVEIIMSFTLQKLGLIDQSFSLYIRWFLLEPMAVNLVILYGGHIIMKHVLIASSYNNYVPIMQMALICMVTACVHNIFPITLGLFCFPLFATIVFSDRKMTRIIGLSCALFLSITLVYRRLAVYRPENDRYYQAEVMVSMAILFAAYLFSEVLIIFSREKTDLIKKAYTTQLEMKEQLNKDQKTGLYGHTIFMNTMDQLVDIAHRTLNPFSVAVLDIDNFKSINDTYGHLKGDQVIRTLAKKMEEIFAQGQLLARYGGEEFAILFSEEDIESIDRLLNELRIAFSKVKYDFMEESVTISIGIAQWQRGWSSEQLFQAADMAMYYSKQEGKNRISIYKEHMERK